MIKSINTLIVLTIILLITPIKISATGGGLRKDSIKTCDNGVTYGLHGDGSGGTHWHVAVTNGKGYYASGSAIYSDPCPNSYSNQSNAQPTKPTQPIEPSNTTQQSKSVESSTTQETTQTEPQKTVKNQLSTPSNTVEQSKQESESIKEKSSDNTIQKIIINNKNISNIDEHIEYQTYDNKANIKVILNDSKANYEVVGNIHNLIDGNNNISIKVIAENGEQRIYNINIVKKIDLNNAMEYLKINNEIVKFNKNNLGKIKELYWTKQFNYSYKLNNGNLILKVYKNNQEIDQNNNLLNIGNNTYEITITDQSGRYITYDLYIERSSLFISIIISIYTFIIMLSLFLIIPSKIIITIIFLSKRIKKKSY